MEIIRLMDGTISFNFNTEEMMQINSLKTGCFIKTGLKSSYHTTETEEKGRWDKGLREATKNFINEIYEKHGSDWISRNHKSVKALERKYFIREAAQILVNLEKKGFAETERIPNDRRHNLLRFRLMIEPFGNPLIFPSNI